MEQNPNLEQKIIKIEQSEMDGLIARAVILANQENTLKFLQNENKINWHELLKKYNLNPDITYGIDQSRCLLIQSKKEVPK